APYVPGQLYLRELPCLLAVLERVARPLDAVLVDGYAVLDDLGRPGLGAHLHAALERRVPVVGVAKTHFRGSTAVEVLRGGSTRPLYVTAVGMGPERAAEGVGRMHGPHRIPTLLRRVDRLCRDASR
ncbi:MAG: endonuclease V, partial [Myxococcales bacterium]|nr:endonuclease V [Myxococcales bacterium]